jgi:adenylate cyclase
VNSTSGWVAVWPAGTSILHLPGGVLAAAIIIAYFGFTVFRIPPVIAVLCVTPYIVGAQVLLLRALSAGVLTTPASATFSTLLWVAYITGLAACAFVDQMERRAFCQAAVIEHQKRVIEGERQRSDRLLENILPTSIADRLKGSSDVIADGFADVTVLFVDVVGFTPLAARMPAEQVVILLNDVFSMFDDLVATAGVEKIKTIGDAYMVACGLPEPLPDHAAVAADLAVAMLDGIRDMRTSLGQPLSVRIGIASGPAVAGVIGHRKFAYDLWGDTVNMAARMESHGLANAIQISESSFRLLCATHDCEPRGLIDIKGKGASATWWLRGRRGASSAHRELAG